MSAKNSSDVIEINVGGNVFATTRGTLSRFEDCMLARMIDGEIPTSKDSNGRRVNLTGSSTEYKYFIDRDPEFFGTILNYMRSGELYIPEGDNVKRLVHDADFYGIQLKKIISETKKRQAKKQQSQSEPPKLADTLRNSTMDTWKQFAISKYDKLVPVIMERIQMQIRTHPFFEAELALSMDTQGRESDDPNTGVKIVARHVDSNFLVYVPLKFVGQPICEIWAERLSLQGFTVSYVKRSDQALSWSIILSWASGFSKKAALS